MAHENDIQAVIDAINTILNDDNLEQYTEDVLNRLSSFGYEPASADAFAIAFAMQGAFNYVCNEINQTAIPDGLRQVFIDMCCGKFLHTAHNTGNLSLSGLDFGGIVQTVSEGDTSVSFDASASDESKFSAMVDYLIMVKDVILHVIAKSSGKSAEGT